MSQSRHRTLEVTHRAELKQVIAGVVMIDASDLLPQADSLPGQVEGGGHCSNP
ncbi:hypothetical protein D3C76_1791680 [compost metagenome]